jgi:cellulose synthase/poly-beta-1,6-N-acetylglucosamine synthase-like glycosyltransferase
VHSQLRLGAEARQVTTARASAYPLVSVLLPVRGESDELEECLASLARQRYPHDRFEVLIADGSDQPIPQDILPRGLDAHVYPNPLRVMSPGLNMLAGHARGDYLAIVSAHSYLPDSYFDRMVATAQATGAANVGARVLKVARSPWGRAIAAATSSPFGVGSSIQHYGDKSGPADSAFPGFISRSTFEKVGGFNVALACNEDDEFNARVRASGGTVWFEPAVEVAYHPRETLLGLFRQYFRYGRWKIAVARLGVPGYLRARNVIPSVVVAGAVLGFLAALLWHPFIIPVAVAGCAYITLMIVEGRRMSKGYGSSVLGTALVFPVLHAAYGIGFLRGLLDRGLPRDARR